MLANGPAFAAEQETAPVVRSGAVGPLVAILRLLASASQPMGVNAVARELGLAPSSCFKILKQLQAEDFADFDQRTKTYSLGVGVIELARSAFDPLQAFQILRPRLEQAAEACSIAIGFWRRIPRSRILLAGFVEGSSPMRIHMSVGQRLPMLMGAVGRAVAAKLELSEMELRIEFSRLRWQVPLSFEEYAAQVEEARQRGFAIDRDNFAAGVTTAAVAIEDRSGAVRYGLSGIMFTGRQDAVMLERIGAELADVAAWAATRLIA